HHAGLGVAIEVRQVQPGLPLGGLGRIPKEGVGFSNDAKIRLSPPKWAEAVFDYDGKPRTIRLKLRYFIGPDAPAG
ncbi:MAG: hypothetical protein JWQ16_2069, partial [Novosphingobium sp.]|nr:hypothetical protein [Novosphingobium sp.]